MRRAAWRWYAVREERFVPRISALPDAQLRTIRAAYDALPHHRRNVIDVGGGSGRWRQLLGEPGDYTIVDVAAPPVLSLAPAVTYVVADAAELPFAAATFGFVLMIEMLQYVSEPTRALAESKRVLSADGVLVLTTRQAWSTHGAANDYFRYTRYGLEHLVRSAGLQTEQMVPLGGPASVATAALDNNLLAKPFLKQLVGHPLWRLAAYLDRTVFAQQHDDVSGWLVVARAG